MSHYQFVLFSGKGQYHPKIKKEDVVITQSSDSSSSKNEREIDSLSSSSHASSSSSSSRKQLIVFPNENSNRVIESESKNKQICIESKSSRKRGLPGNVLQMQLQRQRFNDASAAHLGGKYANSTLGKAKIPRPANAFMLFANEWRKKLALENPRESNKDISVRLGVLWKNMGKDVKEKYFSLARQVDAEHKRKYPDYVYNPKEARLRKAMREQSRELSRQSILQSAVTSNSGNASATGVNSTNRTNNSNAIAGSSNFLNHSMPCASLAPAPTVSSLPGNSSYNSGRIINPWFPVSHAQSTSHIKPMLPHRVMQTHQRTFDTSKEVLRKQAECAAAFSAASATACYPGEFAVRGVPTQATSDTSIGGLESNDYCSSIGEFSDAQKWHPYQSSAAVYHPRSGSMSKIANRHGMQNINTHGRGPWNQFSGVPLFSMTAQNPAIRGTRQMNFFQDQHERRCNFPAGSPINYMTNKMEMGHRLEPEYSQSNYQQENEKCIEDAPKWEPPISIDSTMPKLVTPSHDPEPRIKEQPKEESKEYQEDESTSMKTPSKQPLPGFHQAFGSTEIGKFSRSGLYANIIGDSGSVSRNRSSSIDTTNNSTMRVDHQDLADSSSCSLEDIGNDENIVDTVDGLNGSTNLTNSHFESVRTTIPRWHSPYLIPEGYFPVSVIPYPASPDNLRSKMSINQTQPTTEEIIIPNECYWIAPGIGIPVANISNPPSTLMRLLDVSYLKNPEYLYSNPIIHPDLPEMRMQLPNFMIHDDFRILKSTGQPIHTEKSFSNTNSNSSNDSVTLLNQNTNRVNKTSTKDNNNNNNLSANNTGLDEDDNNTINVDEMDC